MATLVEAVERPAFLDRPAEEQLSFGGGGGGGATAPARSTGRERGDRECGAEAARGATVVPLSERLRAERAAAAAAVSAQGTDRTGTTRGGGATLDELLVGAWEGLSARRPVACPVCAGPMEPRVGAAGGACGGCGSQLR